jgi:hypothetical protein
MALHQDGTQDRHTCIYFRNWSGWAVPFGKEVPPGRYYIVAGLLEAPSLLSGTKTSNEAIAVRVIAGTTTGK